MRWVYPKIGDRRIITKFLIFPKRIGNITKWLETATWREIYCKITSPEGYNTYCWVKDSWIESHLEDIFEIGVDY